MFIKELHNLVGPLVEKEKVKPHKTLQEEKGVGWSLETDGRRRGNSKHNIIGAMPAPPSPVRNGKEIENLQTLLKTSKTDLAEQQHRVKPNPDPL